MDADSWPVPIFILSVILCAYFAAAETAYSAMNKVRVKTMADEGNKKAKRALWVVDRFEKSLSTVLIGSNVFHALCASLATLYVTEKFGVQYVAVGTLITTVAVYLFGEMIPKSFAKAKSETFALGLGGSMAFLVNILTPVSFLFTSFSHIVSRIFKSSDSGVVTEEDLQNIIETIEDEGVLEPEKQELIKSAMKFSEKVAADVMIPIRDVVMLDVKRDPQETVQFIKEQCYSRIPVYSGSRNNIIGILPVNLFLNQYFTKQKIDIRGMLLKAYSFDSDIEISDLLSKMRLNKLQMVFLRNEKRERVGMVTLEDILEELVGEIQDETDPDDLSLS